MRRTAGAPHAAPESALARLLEVESRLEGLLEEARAAADAMLATAEARAGARLGTLAAELAAAEAEMSASLAAEATAQVAREQEALAAIRARYEAVDDGAIETLAAWVSAQVLDGTTADGA